jgi:hypothetical protein
LGGFHRDWSDILVRHRTSSCRGAAAQRTGPWDSSCLSVPVSLREKQFPVRYCAEQSQFSPRCRSGDRRSRGRARQTKPIGRRARKWARAGRTVTWAHGVKQTQFRRSDIGGKCFMEKGLGAIGRAEGLGKTKPIAGPARSTGKTTVPFYLDSAPAPGAQTKPIVRAVAAGTNRVKQTQFRQSDIGGKCFVEKGLGQIGRAAGLVKTKPIGRRARRWARAGGTIARACCAKQTQFASGGQRRSSERQFPNPAVSVILVRQL